jgi:hypothetical protein
LFVDAENREIMGQLLGSTNKAEVLESMEFFRVAWEYQFDSAEVGGTYPSFPPLSDLLTLIVRLA